MCRRNFKSLRKFEQLESRQMMAGDISYSNGIITIEGDGYNDVAEIRFEDDRVYVDLWAGDGDSTPDHHDLDRSISNVTQIVFNGFAGNDLLYVDDSALDPDVSINHMQLLFYGGGDDDSLGQSGGGMRTLAWGGAGDDFLEGGRYNDTMYGGDGDDLLVGDGLLVGEGGDDWLFGGAGNDQLWGVYGNDLLVGEAGDDELGGLGGNDTLNGGDGNDVYHFFDTLFGPGGDDTIIDVGGVDTLDFESESRGISVDLSVTWRQTIHTGGLTLQMPKTIENVVGTAYDDVIRGNSSRNDLDGRDGHDTLEGRGGNDTLTGGAGNDTFVFAGTNLGFDKIFEAAAADNDTLYFTGMLQGLTIDLTVAGEDFAVNSTDLQLLLANDTAIETVYGTRYDDRIIGNTRDNVLYGGDGDDTIDGGKGADRLYGDAGSDRLNSDAVDAVFGGLGNDWFDGLWESSNPTNPNRARYRDWGRI